MNLVIDIGNTQTKLGVFSGPKIVSFYEIDKCTLPKIKAIIFKYPKIKNIILSSVTNHDKLIAPYLKKKFRFVELTQVTKIPIYNKYTTPATLGKDRLACAVASNMLFRNENVLCIDAGTCIKYDFVNSQNEYMGGAISPGIDMRFRALAHYTDKLPLIQYERFNKLIGNSTSESILVGVVVATSEEVKGMVSLYRTKYPHLKIILTGGNIKFLQAVFNNARNKNSSIFAHPKQVLQGLNYILNFNI